MFHLSLVSLILNISCDYFWGHSAQTISVLLTTTETLQGSRKDRIWVILNCIEDAFLTLIPRLLLCPMLLQENKDLFYQSLSQKSWKLLQQRGQNRTKRLASGKRGGIQYILLFKEWLPNTTWDHIKSQNSGWIPKSAKL